MNRFRLLRSFAFLAVLLASVSCFSTVSAPQVPADASSAGRPLPPERGATPKNVILFIGDGMGVSHVTLARLLRGGEFQMGRMPVTGLYTSHSASSFVTDSAASATAIATGVKTTNRMVGVDPSGRAHATVLEKAEELGMATGLVTTASFWDATPASFAAHHTSRYDAPIIIEQMLSKGIELIAGGGLADFESGKLPQLDALAAGAGMVLVRPGEALPRGGDVRVLAVFQGQMNDVDFPEAPIPLLAEWAIGRLSADPDGFFLLVEHEGTDTSSHANENADLIRSLRSLDAAVGKALEFASRRGDTLVIVTADHETGSLELAEGPTPNETTLKWATKGHSGEALPLFAYGPGALRFTGMLDNTDIAKILFELLGAR